MDDEKGETNNCFMQFKAEFFNGIVRHHQGKMPNRWSFILKIAVLQSIIPLFRVLVYSSLSTYEMRRFLHGWKLPKSSTSMQFISISFIHSKVDFFFGMLFNLNSNFKIERQQWHCVVEVHLIFVCCSLLFTMITEKYSISLKRFMLVSLDFVVVVA